MSEMINRMMGRGPRTRVGESMPRLVLLCGQMYAGKDHIFSALNEVGPTRGYKAVRLPFAAALKREVATKHGITLAELEANKAKYRTELQAVGQGRRDEDPDYWIRQWYQDYAELDYDDRCLRYEDAGDEGYGYDRRTPMPIYVVTDGRYPNEAQFIRNLGGLVLYVHASDELRIGRGMAFDVEFPSKFAQLQLHPSEAEVKNCLAHNWISGEHTTPQSIWDAVAKEGQRQMSPLPVRILAQAASRQAHVRPFTGAPN